MAKKEKKSKKEKPQKAKKGKKVRKEKEPEIPYAGSDRLKTVLAVLLAALCGVCIGLSIYTVSYFQRKNVEAAALAASARAEEAALTAAKNDILFSQPDGTYIRERAT